MNWLRGDRRPHHRTGRTTAHQRRAALPALHQRPTDPVGTRPAAHRARPCRHHGDGAALLHKAKGLGYRRIATAINRPVSTVRRWLRRLPPTHLERIYRDGTQRLLALDPDTFTTLRRTGTMLHYALSILAAAAHWERHRYGISDPPWTLIGLYTRGRLLAPPG